MAEENTLTYKKFRCAYGFIPRESGKTRSIGYDAEVIPTMNADGNYAVLIIDAVVKDDRTESDNVDRETIL